MPCSTARLPACLQELIESIGQEKAKVDEEVERGRVDEEAAAALQTEVTAFQEECSSDLAAAEPIIQVGEWVETEGWMDGEMLEQPSQAAC